MILAITRDRLLYSALEGEFVPRGYIIAATPSLQVGHAKFVIDRPRLLVCDAGSDRPEDIDPYRPSIRVAEIRATPVLLVTSWRDLLFDRGHFFNSISVRRAVVFRPFEASTLLREARHLLAGCARPAGE